MVTPQQHPESWNRVTSSAFLFLSAANPPDARASGLVIGPNSRVRPCEDFKPRSQFDVLCLEVDQDGQINRGYTVARMVTFRPESTGRSWTSKRLALGAVVCAGGLVAGFIALL